MLLKYNKKFVIKIRIGSVTLIKGKVHQSLINDCKQLIRRWPQKGYVYAYKRDGINKIRFTKSIDQDFHQRFRNIYQYQKESFQTTPSDKCNISK